MRIAVAVVVALWCVGCGRGSAERGGGAQRAAVVVRDDLGRTVRLARPATRIVSLSPGFTETLFALGCGDAVVLRDRYSDYPAAAARVPAVDALHAPLERIVAARPDLVVSYFSDGRYAEKLARFGIASAVFTPRSVKQVARSMRMLGRLCGAPQAGRALARRLLAAVPPPQTGGPRVFVEVDASDPARPWTAGADTFVHELVTRAGGTNVFGSVRRGYVQVSVEDVVGRRPQVVVRLHSGEGVDLRRWIADVRVIDDVDPDWVSRPGPRLGAAARALRAALAAAR